MTSENNGMYMPVAPAYGSFGNGNDGFFGGNGAWFILILLAMFGWGNGFGGNWGGGNNGATVVGQDVQRGFDQATLTNGISSIQTAMCNGFAGVNQSLATGFAGVNQGLSNGFAQAEIAANSRQMADMNQQFALQSALQNCCCENRAATADLKYTVATEACADRASVSNALNTVLNTMNNGFQSIRDQMCQDKIDAKNEKIADLQQQLNMAAFNASQISQNNYLQNALTAQTQYFLSLYPPTATAATATRPAAA